VGGRDLTQVDIAERVKGEREQLRPEPVEVAVVATDERLGLQRLQEAGCGGLVDLQLIGDLAEAPWFAGDELQDAQGAVNGLGHRLAYRGGNGWSLACLIRYRLTAAATHSLRGRWYRYPCPCTSSTSHLMNVRFSASSTPSAISRAGLDAPHQLRVAAAMVIRAANRLSSASSGPGGCWRSTVETMIRVAVSPMT
jgi:hypothetical protein